jgi:hypothetical protein
MVTSASSVAATRAVALLPLLIVANSAEHSAILRSLSVATELPLNYRPVNHSTQRGNHYGTSGLEWPDIIDNVYLYH